MHYYLYTGTVLQGQLTMHYYLYTGMVLQGQLTVHDYLCTGMVLQGQPGVSGRQRQSLLPSDRQGEVHLCRLSRSQTQNVVM